MFLAQGTLAKAVAQSRGFGHPKGLEAINEDLIFYLGFRFLRPLKWEIFDFFPITT